MPAVKDQSVDLQTALNQTSMLLEKNPNLAAEQAQEILKALPEQPNAMMLLALAKGRMSKLQESVDILRSLVSHCVLLASVIKRLLRLKEHYFSNRTFLKLGWRWPISIQRWAIPNLQMLRM